MGGYFALIKSSARACVSCWKPLPVARPVPPKDLQSYSFLKRSALCLHYKIRCLEYSLSSGGRLREWLKLNLLLSLIIGIPTVTLVPVVTLAVTEILALAIPVAALLKTIFTGVVYGLATVALLTGLGIFIRSRENRQ